MRSVENAVRRWGFYRVAGCDEVGRGCLAGPVVAGAVILDPSFHIPGLADSKTITAADLAGKVVVLHFWEYRDTPLEEPYGQTGYLDFLSRKHGKGNVLVYGVNVDPKLGDDETRRGSIASARRLKSFMNLSFPILLDDGALLKRVGDPRQGGGKLPLFLVINKEGKIAEYSAGLYDVQANTGLAELDAVIEKLK